MLCIFGKLCQVGVLVVCKCSSVLLQSIVMSYVDYVVLVPYMVVAVGAVMRVLFVLDLTMLGEC